MLGRPSSAPLCEVPGCEKPRELKGRNQWKLFCSMHQDRKRRLGSPDAAPLIRDGLSPQQRFKNRLYGREWQPVKRAVLERDGYQCQIKGPKCRGAAKAVDHIVLPRRGGAWYEMSNLRAACDWCNNWRASVDRARNHRLEIVVGPQGWA
jgi:5-methylcytosine-specific restriction enzyme A